MPRYNNQPNTLKELQNPRIVNSYNGKALGITYYISNNKLYKRMKSGLFREICSQYNKGDRRYTFYFIKNKGCYAGMSRINVRKLDQMELVEEVIDSGIGEGIAGDFVDSGRARGAINNSVVDKGGESVAGESH
jgi:hypothetical protein